MVNKTNLKLGAIVGAVSMLLAYLFGTVFKKWGATLTFATYDINIRSQLEAGIGATDAGTLADKLLSLFSGVIPATFTDYLLVFAAGFLIVVIGKWTVDTFKLKSRLNVKNELWLIMLIGTIAISTLIKYTSVLTLSYIPTLIGLAIYFAIVTFVIQLLIKQGWVPSSWVSV